MKESRSAPGALPGRSGPEALALRVLYAFTAIAVLGYGLFGLRPENIPQIPALLSFFTVSFRVFAQGHITLALVVLGIALTRAAGWRWIPALAVVSVTAFTAEHVGTGYGLPFGEYGYTSMLGPKLAGRVPFLIPLSWFMMAVPAFAVARMTFPGPKQHVGRIALAAALLTIWDLALDPAMSFLTPYWVWGQEGPFYGMPWINLLGWFGTGVVIMALLEALGGYDWIGLVSSQWMLAYYGAVLLMPLGMVAVAGLWVAVLATIVPLAVVALMHRVLRGGKPDLAPMSSLTPERP